MPNDRPIVRVIGTGGSIAGVGPDRMDFILYPEIGDHITIQQSLDRVPEIQDFAEWSALAAPPSERLNG